MGAISTITLKQTEEADILLHPAPENCYTVYFATSGEARYIDDEGVTHPFESATEEPITALTVNISNSSRTLTDDYFSNPISKIFTNKSVYLTDTFTQDVGAKTITWGLVGGEVGDTWANNQLLIAEQ